MNEKKKMQPKVRFREFTGENASDWEQRKAKEIFITISEKGYIDLPVLSASQEFGMVERNNIGIDIKYDLNSIKNYKRVLPKQFVIHLRSFQGGFAWSTIEGITSPAYTVIDFIEKCNQDFGFWKISLTSTNFIKKLETVTYGIRDGRSISFKDFSSMNFLIPNINEQKRIGKLFEKLDKLITLHQRKLEQLEQLKNTLLSKMFPKSGTNIPEIRFSGFTDAWKHHKLGNTIEKNSLRNKDLLINNVESVSNKYGFIRQTEQFDDYTVASNDLSNYYIILEKFFAYNPSRINVGSIAYKTAGSPVSIVSPLYVSFSTKDMVDDRFLWYWFKTNEFKQQREKYSEGGVRDTLSYNQLSKMNILLPELNEQIKIGKYLDSLTKTIAIHQRKLDQLKNLKQTLLNKMFI